MTCVICGIEIDSIEEAMDQGWIPLTRGDGK